MRFHLVSLPHTQTTDDFSSCAYTQKVRGFARMMMELGHEVFLYAGEFNNAPCTEHVSCISEAGRLAACGGLHYTQASFDGALPHWVDFNRAVIAAIQHRIQPKDFICVISGRNAKPIADAFFPGSMTVEFGIGYGGTFSQYRIWESYAWMHTVYGAQCATRDPHTIDGIWFDAVIPGYLDITEFPFSEEKDDYFLYVGRLTDRKGWKIAEEICKHRGKRLIIAGQGDTPTYGEHVGSVVPPARNLLMMRAQALIMPTVYIEPFGNVAIEAMACGTPVISTDWGAMTETVIEGVTGFRCRTFQEFVEATYNVKHLNCKNIRSWVAQNYSLAVIAKQYERHFHRLMNLWTDGWYYLPSTQRKSEAA